MADRSLAVRRLGLLLAKTRDELRQFLDAFQCAISGEGNVNWHGFCLEVPDPGNGGTISFPEETPHINLSNFAIFRSNIPVSEADIDTAASCLEDFDLARDAKRLRDEFQNLKDTFCSLGDWIQHPDGVVSNRKFYARACAAALWEHVNQLIGTVEAVSPPADVAALATGSFFTPGSPKPAEDRPPPDPEHSDEETKPRWDSERRELSYGGIACKTFRQRAPNQELVLAAFEEVGWPPRIDDPIPPSGGVDQRQRLADTVRALNANHGTLRFELDGTGEGVIWKPVPNESRSVTDTSELPF